MIKTKIILGITSVLMLVLASGPLLGTVQAATPKDAVCQGVGLSGGLDDCSTPDGDPNLDNTIEVAINILSIVVAIVSVVMIIIGGLKYVMSAGESAKVASAKDTIIYAIVGLVVAALAQFIVKFVLQKL